MVLALQLGKCLSALTLTVAKYVGDGNLCIIVQDGLRYPAEEREGSDMAIQEYFCVFSRVSFDKAGI